MASLLLICPFSPLTKTQPPPPPHQVCTGRQGARPAAEAEVIKAHADSGGLLRVTHPEIAANIYRCLSRPLGTAEIIALHVRGRRARARPHTGACC